MKYVKSNQSLTLITCGIRGATVIPSMPSRTNIMGCHMEILQDFVHNVVVPHCMANADAVVTLNLIKHLFINLPANIGISPLRRIQNTDFPMILNAYVTDFIPSTKQSGNNKNQLILVKYDNIIRQTHLHKRYMGDYVVAYLTEHRMH